MKIILEGMDNTGKTTLGKKLSEALGLSFTHSKRPGDYLDLVKEFSSLLCVTEDMDIRDRTSIVSEPIYGPICRKRNMMMGHSWALLYDYLEEGGLIIYCRPKDDNVYDFGSREQMEGVIDNSVKLLIEYDKLFNKLSTIYPRSIIYYDYTDSNDGVKYRSFDKIVTSCKLLHNKYKLKQNRYRSLIGE